MTFIKIAIASVALLGVAMAVPTTVEQPELVKPVVVEEQIQQAAARDDAANAVAFKAIDEKLAASKNAVDAASQAQAMSVQSVGSNNDKVAEMAKNLEAAQKAVDALQAHVAAKQEENDKAIAAHEALVKAAGEAQAQREADVASSAQTKDAAAAALAAAQADHAHGTEMLKTAAAALSSAEAEAAAASQMYNSAVSSLSAKVAAYEAAKEQYAADKAAMCELGSSTWHADYCKGCDGEVGSGKETDLCGVCGGDNSSCKDCAGVPNGKASVRDYCGHTGCDYDRKAGGCENMRRDNVGWQGAGWREIDSSICGVFDWYRNEHCCRKECY